MLNQFLNYNDCVEIVKNNPNFIEKKEVVEGYEVSTFNYILSIYPHFKEPFAGATYSAFEMRGLTFIHTAAGPIRNLMLHKFFNLNENGDYLLEDLSKHVIVMIQEKLDGSMIRPVMLPNGKIVCKTKMGFSNKQAKMANEFIAANPNYGVFIDKCLKIGYAPIFELVSPHNKIVLNYNKTELRLIQLRSETDGSYLNPYGMDLVSTHNIALAKQVPLMSFAELLERQKTEIDKEGYVVTLSNGVKFKLKTVWYFERHKLLDNASYENILVEMIMDEKLDDALVLLDKDNERRVYAEKMQVFLSDLLVVYFADVKNLITKYQEIKSKFDAEFGTHPYLTVATQAVNDKLQDAQLLTLMKSNNIDSSKLDELKTLMVKYKGVKKEFAMTYMKNNKFFNIAMKVVDSNVDVEEEALKLIKEGVKFECRRLEMAKAYLHNKGFQTLNLEPLQDE